MYELNTGTDDDNQPNESNCSVPENKGILTTGASVCGVSIIACVVPIILVVTLKLHRQFTYRAALYQVVAALLFVLALLLDTIFALMMGSNNHLFQSPCKFAAFLIQFFLWLKLLFVSLIVVHLFMFAIVYKNIRRFEIIYVCSSIVISLVIASVPFITNTYGLAGSWCWITNWKNDCPSQVLVDGVIEQFSTLYGPGFVLLSTDSVVAIAIVLVLAARIRRRKNGEMSSTPGYQHSEALKQMVPLLAYPILFFFLFLPAFANRIYGATPHRPNTALMFLAVFCIASWGWVAGLTLMVHIGVLLWSRRRKLKQSGKYGATEEVDVYATMGALSTSNPTLSTSRTHFILPEES